MILSKTSITDRDRQALGQRGGEATLRQAGSVPSLALERDSCPRAKIDCIDCVQDRWLLPALCLLSAQMPYDERIVHRKRKAKSVKSVLHCLRLQMTVRLTKTDAGYHLCSFSGCQLPSLQL